MYLPKFFKSLFERQLLESNGTFDPADIFELETCQENEDEIKDLNNKMDLRILELPDEEGNDEDNKLQKLSSQMTPIPGCDGVFKKLCQSGQGSLPPIDSVVTIHFDGYLQDEISNQIKSFDSTILRGKPHTFM